MVPGTWAAQDEAGVFKQQNFIQTDNVTVLPDSAAPFSFVGSLKKVGSALTQTGTVALPTAATYTPNPFTVVSPAQIVGTHYYYSVPFSSMSLLEAMFPAGTYQFDTTRNYFTGAATATSQGVTFTGSHGMPSQVPKLSGTWVNGRLRIPAGTVDLSWDLWNGPKSPQSRIEFRIAGTNVSGWAISRSDESSVKLMFLKPNSIYQASLRFLNVEDQQTVVDANTADKDLGFSASYATVTQFAVEVLPDPTWPLLGTLSPSPSLKGIAATASNSVVVGSSGRVAVLDHATGSWQVRDSVTSKTWNAIIHANGQYLVVGSGGSVRTSPDGNTWTDRATGRTEALQSVIWTGSQYVAVGDGGLILVSADGVTWTVRTSGILTPLLTVAYSGGVYVAAGDSGIRISNDSISWRAPSNPSALGGGSTLCWARNKFLLGTTFGVNKLWQSTDGETWVSVQGYSDGVSRLISVGGVAYASGIGGQGAYLKRSLDGVGWSDISPLGRIQINRIAWNGEALILLDSDGNVLKGAGLTYEFFSFEQATSNYDENAGSAAVKVLRHGPASSPRSVDYETQAGSATDGQDYAGSSGTINFLAGETVKTLTFGLTNDSQIEEFENFAVLLKSPPAGTELGGPSSTWIGIVDDEPRPVFQFQLASHTVSEEAGFVDLQVVRSWDVASPAAVNYATQADSATA
ncbi:MAG: Calx-beta domain-containing protein, partial [Verrucomicrobium sp.]